MPDAPKPVYNSNGTEQHEWLMVVAYRPARDCYTLSWTRDGDLHQRTLTGAVAYPVQELEDLITGTVNQIRVLGAPRLF